MVSVNRLTPTVLLVAALLGGCFGEDETPFPPGLEPLEEEHLAPAPEPRDGEDYPEELVLVQAQAELIPRTPAVHARGFIRAPIADVWEALRDPDVGADRRTFASWTVTRGIEPEYDFSYVIHSVIQNVITVEYDVTWRHGVVEGTIEEPTLVAARFQKTAGSTVIMDLRGSVVLYAREDGVTEVEIIEYLQAIASDHGNIEGFLRDMFAELVIRSHGGDLPPISEL